MLQILHEQFLVVLFMLDERRTLQAHPGSEESRTGESKEGLGSSIPVEAPQGAPGQQLPTPLNPALLWWQPLWPHLKQAGIAQAAAPPFFTARCTATPLPALFLHPPEALKGSPIEKLSSEHPAQPQPHRTRPQ